MIAARAALLLAASALLAAPAVAQRSVRGRVDAILTGAYRWRGIPRAGGFNSQIEASARVGSRKTGFSAGVWSNVELGTRRSGTLSDLRPGHWGPSELDFWGEAARSFHAGDAAAGFVWYQYRGRAGGLGTGEIYGRFRGSGLGTAGVSPELSLWYDVVKRKSGYLEAGATVPVLALPLRGLGALAYVGASAGFALGRPARRAELAATTFDSTGFTSGELSAGARVSGQRLLHGLLLQVAGHLQYTHDPATRRTRLFPAVPSSTVRPYLTFGIGFRWPAPADR